MKLTEEQKKAARARVRFRADKKTSKRTEGDEIKLLSAWHSLPEDQRERVMKTRLL